MLSALLRRFSIFKLQRRVLHARYERAGLVRRTLHLGPHRLAFWEGGNGSPLLLLHGFGGDGTVTWAAQVGALVRHHRLVVPDLLYFGESTSAVHDFTVEAQAEAYVQLLDVHGIDRFDVAGISYGGLVAFCLAHEQPERVRRLVMVSSPGPAYHRDDHEAAMSRFGVDDLAGVVLPDDPQGVQRLIELAWYRPPPLPRFLLEDVFEQLFTDQVEEKRELLARVQDTRESLARRGWVVDQPTLLVWGDHDPLFPLHVGLRLESMLPDARLVLLPGTRHAPNTQQPRRFNQAVLSFLGAPAA